MKHVGFTWFFCFVAAANINGHCFPEFHIGWLLCYGNITHWNRNFRLESRRNLESSWSIWPPPLSTFPENRALHYLLVFCSIFHLTYLLCRYSCCFLMLCSVTHGYDGANDNKMPPRRFSDSQLQSFCKLKGNALLLLTLRYYWLLQKLLE